MALRKITPQEYQQRMTAPQEAMPPELANPEQTYKLGSALDQPIEDVSMGAPQVRPAQAGEPVSPQQARQQRSRESEQRLQGKLRKLEMETDAGQVKQADHAITATTNEGKSWWEEPLQAGRAILDGLAFGTADELGAGVAAAMATVLDGADYGDTYNDMMSVLQKEREEFATAHPGANIGLNIVGGILSPVNVLGAAALTGKTTGMALNTGKQVATSAPVAKVTGKIAEIGAKAPGPQWAKGMGVAATEGAVAGAASAEPGSRVEGAKTGALFGAAVSGAVSGAVKGASIVTSEKVKEPLRNMIDGIPTFKPLNIAARHGDGVEGFIQLFYNRAIGGAWISGAVIRKQSQPWLDAASVKVADIADTLAQAKIRTKQAVARLKVYNTNARERIKKYNDEAYNKQRMEISDEANATATRDALVQQQQAAETARQAQDILDDAQKGFRVKVGQAALPAEVTKGANKTTRAAAQSVADSNSQNGLEQVRALWNEYGFAAAKKRSYTMRPAGLAKKLWKTVTENKLLGPDDKAALQTFVDGIEQQFAELMGDTNKITGADLFKMRTMLSDTAASFGDAKGLDALKQKAYRDMVGVIDDTIVGQLKGKSKEAFLADKDAWAVKTAWEKASDTAIKNRGEFSTDEWLAAVRSTAGRRSNVGAGPLQAEASDMAEQAEQVAAELKRVSDDAINTMAEEAKITAARDAARLAKLEAENAARVERLTLEARNDPQKVADLARERAKHKRIQADLEQAEGVLAELKASSPAERLSLFERSYATTITGAILATTVNLVDAFTAGIIVSPILASEVAQMLVAGQTKWQKTGQAILDGIYSGNRTVSGATSRAATNQVNTEAGAGTLYEQMGGIDG